MKIYKRYSSDRDIVLYNGDCFKLLEEIPNGSLDLIVTSPPYFMGKEYDKSKRIEDFMVENKAILSLCVDKLKEGGSLCWQVGNYIRNGTLFPLDYFVYRALEDFSFMKLRNRIIRRYGHGLHSKKRFTGRHETVLWYTKGDDYKFNLDAVRIPQKYPGKKYSKGKKKGEYSGNPLGKNPSDVWEIPNVKANHVEKTDHPCQYPVALVRRLVLSMTNRGDVVFDPFMGSASTGVAAILEGRKFIGAETKKSYFDIAIERCRMTINGTVRIREDKPILKPNKKQAVAQKPGHFIV